MDQTRDKSVLWPPSIRNHLHPPLIFPETLQLIAEIWWGGGLNFPPKSNGTWPSSSKRWYFLISTKLGTWTIECDWLHSWIREDIPNILSIRYSSSHFTFSSLGWRWIVFLTQDNTLCHLICSKYVLPISYIRRFHLETSFFLKHEHYFESDLLYCCYNLRHSVYLSCSRELIQPGPWQSGPRMDPVQLRHLPFHLHPNLRLQSPRQVDRQRCHE